MFSACRHGFLTHIYAYFTHWLRTQLTHLSRVCRAELGHAASTALPTTSNRAAITFDLRPCRFSMDEGPALQLDSVKSTSHGPSSSATLVDSSTAVGARTLSEITYGDQSGTVSPTPKRSRPLEPPILPRDITVVSTAAELQAALLSGARDIEIRAHLDLEDVPAVPIPVARQGMFDNSAAQARLVFAIVHHETRSLRVRHRSLPAACVSQRHHGRPPRPAVSSHHAIPCAGGDSRLASAVHPASAPHPWNRLPNPHPPSCRLRQPCRSRPRPLTPAVGPSSSMEIHTHASSSIYVHTRQ